MNFEAEIAIRHLKSGGRQTLLTVSAVAVAVTVVIFITSLIKGVQQLFFGDLIGTIPHVTVRPFEPKPRSLAESLSSSNKQVTGKDALLTTRREKQAQQRKDLENWRQVEAQLLSFPGVRAVVPTVSGQAFLMRGTKRFGLGIVGADPAQEEQIAHLQKDLVAGQWLSMGPNDILLAYKLADEAEIAVGDRVRVQSQEGITSVFTVAGIYDAGVHTYEQSTAYVTLRAGQALFATRQSVSMLTMQLEDAYDANRVADQITAALPYKVDSWMREQYEIMEDMRVQNMTSNMISAFAMLASALGITSILIVSVIQKSKQIGILKSMGARDRQIMLIFTLEGLGIGVIGALVGGALSLGLLLGLMQVKREENIGKVDMLFPIILEPQIFGGAMLIAVIATVLAALLPAQRAARLNPVEVIRGG